MTDTIFACSIPAAGTVPACGATGLATHMWNLDRKTTGGKNVVVCGKHAHMARQSGIRAFRLSETFALDAKRKAEKQAARNFFNGIAVKDALRRATVRRPNGHHS